METVIEKVKIKKTWKDLQTHYEKVLSDPWYNILANLQHYITTFTYQFYSELGYKTMHLPITTGSISSPMGLGSDSTPVKVNLCNVDTYLADSMQFMLEYGCRLMNTNAYYVMPSFRGEDADKRHLCQFYHSEAEIFGSLDDVIRLVENYLSYLARNILNVMRDEISSVSGDISHIEKLASLEEPIERITLDDGIYLLQKHFPTEIENLITHHEEGFKTISNEGENRLIDLFGGFVWLTKFDHLSVPFYQAFDPLNNEKAMNADLLFGIGEVVGCGERHSTEEEVVAALNKHCVPREEYEWYCNMKKIDPQKTSGFGLGIERFILWLVKHDDIRDCQILPRFNGLNIVP